MILLGIRSVRSANSLLKQILKYIFVFLNLYTWSSGRMEKAECVFHSAKVFWSIFTELRTDIYARAEIRRSLRF